MDRLDINDTCKCPITNPKRRFCLWQNHTKAHNPRKHIYSNKTTASWK